MEKKKFGQEKVLLGIKTIVLGLVLYVLEFLSLPIFGAIHKAQVDGQGFYSDFWKYVGTQPYPAMFITTAVIVALGIFVLVSGCKDMKQK